MTITLRHDSNPPPGHHGKHKSSVNPMDEILADNASVHIERLSDKSLWMRIESEGRAVRVHVWSRGMLYVGAEWDD
jgi:hypothetical protein